jgi:hypothetical protein
VVLVDDAQGDSKGKSPPVQQAAVVAVEKKPARVSPNDEREVEPGRVLRREEAEEILKMFDMNSK